VWFELEPSFEKDVQSLNDESRKKTAPREFAKVLTLPVAMRDATVLLKLLRLSLQSDPPKSPIQKIRMMADAAAPRVAQSGLFVPRGPDPEKLELTVARLMKLVGDSNVGVAELIDTHRAENFRVGRWSCGAIAEEDRRGRRVGKKQKSISSGETLSANGDGTKVSAAGFRALRPPLVAMVEADEKNERRPLRVSFSGMRGDVIAASGPWRSSGEWWQEDGWDFDEWDLAIDFGKRAEPREKKPDDIVARMHTVTNASARVGAKTKIPEPSPWPRHGVYRIFYDLPRKSWFVRGFYD
jgi:protein ImuB